jgi:membrane associated rhomboid family serine protease
MAQTCYRHPNRETGVSCSSCGRPICPDCMTPTPVGMRCPECAQQRTKVVRNPTGTPGQASAFPATVALIAINVVVYLVEILGGPGGLSNPSPSFIEHWGLIGNQVADGEVYRLLTSGFVHFSLTHVGFNMVVLFFLGRLVEPAVGTPRFLGIYFASLFAGALGALILSAPYVITAGASGAIFGVAGAGIVIALERRAEQVVRSLGMLLVLNFIFDLTDREVSLGGHVGGLVGGAACAAIIIAGERGMLGRRRLPAELAAMTGVAVVAILWGIAVA